MDEDESRCTEIARRLREVEKRLTELQPPVVTTSLEPGKPPPRYMITAAIEGEERALKAERARLEAEKKALFCD